jgi:hypothetical protein
MQRLPIAEGVVRGSDGRLYAARMYPEPAGTYSGATDLTEYFVRVGQEWRPTGWSSMPTSAYRALRGRLAESRALHKGRVLGA